MSCVQPILNLKGLKADDKHVFEASPELHAQGKFSFVDAFPTYPSSTY